jgi:hypothetical protein
MTPKLLKYTLYSERAKEKDLSLDTDRAVANFRAFYATAALDSERVDDPFAIDVMVEVLDNLKNNLQKRRSVLKT